MSNINVRSNKTYQNVLSAMQNLEEMGGVANTEEYVEIMLDLISEASKRMCTAAQNSDGPKLTDSTKKEVIGFLFDCHRSGSFGDGLEDDYIMGGTFMVGLDNMTDKQLIEELYQVTGEDEELVIRAKAELGIEEMLGGE
jgi:hypothetical protein